jgi:hypothetical protein
MRFSKLTVVLSAAAASYFATSTALAQDEPAPAGDAPAAAEPTAPPAGEAAAPAAAPVGEPAAAGAAGEAKGVHEHDGFYFRFGLGLGYLIGKSSPDDVPAGATAIDTNVKGLGIPTELAFGGTIAPGLVLGGGSYGVFVPSPKAKADVSGAQEVDAGAITLSGIGPFVDYYFDPKGGAHAEAALLLAYAQIAEKEQNGVTTPKASGPGFGFMIGGGYDFWIGEQWSLGVLARIAYYNTKATVDTSGDPKLKFSAFVPGIMAALTYH